MPPRAAPIPPRPRLAVLLAVPMALAACDGPQSALAPAGADAETIARLFWVMLAGAVVLWLLVNGLALVLTRLSPGEHSPRLGHALIVGGGIAFPTVVLAALLVYGISIMPRMREPGPTGVPLARVTGEQWWWRVAYADPNGGPPIVAANEVRLPVGTRSELTLGSDLVIHSFWVPSLAGKADMFPGRDTRISLEPTRAGEFRGQCAEFCGESHGLMAFTTVTMAAPEFDAWLAREAGPAREPETEAERAGRAVFLAEGCGACHAIRGTPAEGTYGPDLTHVGSRGTLGAGILPNEPQAMARWIAHTEEVKPGVKMPAYPHLEGEDLDALVAYLGSLE